MNARPERWWRRIRRTATSRRPAIRRRLLEARGQLFQPVAVLRLRDQPRIPLPPVAAAVMCRAVAVEVQAVAAATLPVVAVVAAVVRTTRVFGRAGPRNESDNEPVFCFWGRLFIGRCVKTAAERSRLRRVLRRREPRLGCAEKFRLRRRLRRLSLRNGRQRGGCWRVFCVFARRIA